MKNPISANPVEREVFYERPTQELFINNIYLRKFIIFDEKNKEDQYENEQQIQLLELIREEKTEENLIQIGCTDLIEMIKGARAALNSKNPDYSRHLAVSLRELITHLLHRLAPDEQVKLWIEDPNLLHQGKPTRKARLLYICRSINHGKLTTFIEQNIKTYLSFIELFQSGTHEVNTSYTDQQLEVLFLEAESLINFLCKIGQLNKHK